MNVISVINRIKSIGIETSFLNEYRFVPNKDTCAFDILTDEQKIMVLNHLLLSFKSEKLLIEHLKESELI